MEKTYIYISSNSADENRLHIKSNEQYEFKENDAVITSNLSYINFWNNIIFYFLL